MGRKMSNAPVYFTVVQVRFNTILNLDSYLPTIQDRLRREGFPDYKRETLQRISIPGGRDAEQGGAPSVEAHTRCIFGNTEGTTTFILESNSLGFQTTAYDTFETFSKTFLKGLGILNDALNLDFTERLGLRYLDAVLPADSETLDQYIVPETLGLSHRLTGQLSHSVSETASLSQAGQLISRVIIQNGKVGLPPELSGLAPRIDGRFTDTAGLHAIIDTDAFIEQREKFDISGLEVRLSALHDEITNAFRMTVTEQALKSWA